jgi:DNA invertase Pin-like site-specific DNA recombinase
LLVTRLDRLARSTRDLLNTLDGIAKAGAGFRSLADHWCNTTTPHGRLMLVVLGGLAEFERELIKARTAEGRQRAKARGVRFGGKLKLSRHQILEAIGEGKPGRPWPRSVEATTSAIRPFRALKKHVLCIRHELLENVCAPTATIKIIREADTLGL